MPQASPGPVGSPGPSDLFGPVASMAAEGSPGPTGGPGSSLSGIPGLQLRVTQGAAAGKVYQLEGEAVCLGRSSPGVDPVRGFLSIDDDTVSRLHAELRWHSEQGAYLLTNRSVTNPTTVNHVLVESAWLQPGDVIVMGECVCVLQRLAPSIACATSDSESASSPSSSFFQSKPSSEGHSRSGALPLTDRPALYLESPEGARHPVTGLLVALGGTLVEEGAQVASGFDQEISLPIPNLPSKLLSLAWRDLAHAFEIRALNASVPVVLVRTRGGLQWRAPLPTQVCSQLREGDAIQMGEIELRVCVGQA